MFREQDYTGKIIKKGRNPGIDNNLASSNQINYKPKTLSKMTKAEIVTEIASKTNIEKVAVQQTVEA